ncbi:hypothetical protein P7C70_g2214, partial [Phenoliferia sp. Uapishka_3]
MSSPRPAYAARLEYKPSIHLEVWLPSSGSSPAPVVAWTHGGAFIDGAAGDLSDANLLPTLERGWAFVSIEYRLAPQVKLEQQLEDVREAYEFIRSGKLDEKLGGGKVDGKKLICSGSSAGGTLCLLAGYSISPPPLAVHAFYPVSSLADPSYSAPVAFPSHIPYSEIESYYSPTPTISHSPAQVDFSTMVSHGRTKACLWAVQEGRVAEFATGVKDNSEGGLEKFEVKNLVGEETPPTVIVHGDKDGMVPFGLSEGLVKVLVEKGREAKMISAEGENHGFDLVPGVLEDERKRQWIDEANDFVARFV